MLDFTPDYRIEDATLSLDYLAELEYESEENEIDIRYPETYC